ncbi:sterol 24-C-methyltransferase [Aureococcus anophagefferens]|nr:sterol 24-C-methyltransferase [Aureococcus anophagefferens]
MTMQARLCDALRAAQSNPAAAAGGLCAVAMVAPICANGLKLTVRFLSSLSTSKKHGRIDGYNKLQEGDDAGERNTEYAALVDSYYDLATEFYEWGWGACFHFADRGARPRRDLACYEWCLTDAYDGSERHKKLKKDIEVGDGLPDLCHVRVHRGAEARASASSCPGRRRRLRRGRHHGAFTPMWLMVAKKP